MRAQIAWIVLAIALFAGSAAHAQSVDVPALIKLIENQPNDLDRTTWKEKRRDAARKLGQSKDKRAVPVLINLADTETFDIIGEISIEGLGNLKDQAAVPTLQRIAADPSRDRSSRELARKALAKLGAPEVAAGAGTGSGAAGGGKPGGGAGSGAGSGAPGGSKLGGGGATGGGTTTGGKPGGGGASGGKPGGGAPGGGTTSSGATGGGAGSGAATAGGASGGGATGAGAGGASGGGATGAGAGGSGLEGHGAASGGLVDSGGSLIGEKESGAVEGQPALGDDVIAAYDRLTFAVGTAGLQYDNARSRVDFDADVSGRYAKGVDTARLAWGFDTGVDIVAGYINPDGVAQTRGGILNAHGNGEVRFYSGTIYGIAKGAIALSTQYVSYTDDTGNKTADTSFAGDFLAAVGGGYGRVIDVGSRLRVHRLSRLLDDARALGKPIDAATSRTLQLTWWALRGERSVFRTLIATIAILRDAGILLGEPNAVLTYEILTVLRDTQLYARPSGLDIQLVFGEGYLHRPPAMGGGCSVQICGRVEQVIASAGYGAQLEDDKLELSGGAYARYRLFAPNNEPSPWAAGATARMRRFTYGAHGDPFGLFDLRGTVGVSNDSDPNAMSDTSLRIEGELGFTYLVNQASGLRLAAQIVEDAGKLFIGARLEASYGLLDATFAQ